MHSMHSRQPFQFTSTMATGVAGNDWGLDIGESGGIANEVAIRCGACYRAMTIFGDHRITKLANLVRDSESNVFQPQTDAAVTPVNAANQHHSPDHQPNPEPTKNSSAEPVLKVTGPNAATVNRKPFSASSCLTK